MRLSCASPETLGVLHSTKHSSLNFRKFAAVDETALYAISRKECNLSRFTKILEPFSYRVVPFYLIFPLEFCGTVFRISEIQSFTFHLPTPECLAEWRAPQFNTQVEFQPNGCRWESFYSLFLLLPLRIVNPHSCFVLIFPTFPIKCDATNSARLAVLFYWKYFLSCWGLYMM